MRKLGLLLILFLATVCAAAGQSHSQSSEEQQRIELLLGFEPIPVPKSQGLFSGLGDSVSSWLSSASEAFWGALQRFSIARHAFYSAVVDHITGAVDRILPPSASLRFKTSLGSYGATEPLPAIIPEPPTISTRSGLRLKMFLIWRQVLQEFRATSFEAPEGGSCLDVAKHKFHGLRGMFKSQLETSLCGPNFRGGHCTHKFCKLLRHDSKAAVDKALGILGVDLHQLVLDHVTSSCTGSTQSASGINAQFQIGENIDVESYVSRMVRIATSPSRLFMSFYTARPRPTFYYRRAMIFRGGNEPQVSLEFYVFRNGAGAGAGAGDESNLETKFVAGQQQHSMPLLPEGFLKPQETEKPEIKMNTGHGATAAAF